MESDVSTTEAMRWHLAGAGVNLTANQQAFANISTTANIYTHTSSESERGAAVAIERAIFGDLFSTVLKIETRTAVAIQSREVDSSQLQ